ncbi:hypothetical protein EUTSA_v10027383mg [Eutrema salsugineum]|uniref:Bifunctional inhibitor/plant lipid transfer protein/seed storage helical domain-containing protein n=1 Tax=Eutrema salsugineum TaxID=72664 RepID=V4P8Y7_EUTSA|nr:non-specific lipid transfer protein-like 1 [Eutrema salsugineum]ESQ56091.1 hypothetical protein EUTSA_v10027383mg [Eutrema salsugineum]
MAAKITTVVFILILSITFSSSSAVDATTQAPSSSPVLTCTEELVMFSPCLPFVSAPPNNMSETPNQLCCSVFSSSVHSSAGNCLCYLLRQPMILGFPLDRSRLLSLSQMCIDRSSNDEYFESRCSPSESPELPPLQSIQFKSPFVPGDRVSASPQSSVGLAPETVGNSPISDQFSPEETASLSSPPSPLPQSISNDSQNTRNFLFLLTIIMTLATSIFLTRI